MSPGKAPLAPLMKCCLEAFIVALTEEMFFFLISGKTLGWDNMAEAYYCVTLSPNNLEPVRDCLLVGTWFTLCSREKVHRRLSLCLLPLGAQGHSRPRIVLYSCSGSFIAEGVCAHQRAKNLLPLFQSWKEKLAGAFFQDLYQSVFASKQNTTELDRLRQQTSFIMILWVIGVALWCGKLIWGCVV